MLSAEWPRPKNHGGLPPPGNPEPRSLRIALHRGRSPIARLIQWQTRSPWSHASVVLPDGSVLEAREFRGVRHLPCLPADEDIDCFLLTTGPVPFNRACPPPRLVTLAGRAYALPARAQELQIETFLRRQVGKRYDYSSVARFLSRRQAARDECGKWFCSELVFAACLRAGIPLLERIEPWAVSPALLALSPCLVPVKRDQ